jgi:fluoroquinolone resistance protein
MHQEEREQISIFLSATEFEGATFKGETAIELNLNDCKFIDCIFERCQLSSVKIQGAVIQAAFKHSKIEGVNFFTAKKSLLSVNFESCLIRHSSFAELKLPKIKFTGCELQNVDFSDADLTSADFSNTTFVDCVFRNTNLSKADFRYASGFFIDPTQNKLKGARFSSPDVLNLLAGLEIVIE